MFNIKYLTAFRPLLDIPAMHFNAYYQFLGPSNIIKTRISIQIPNSIYSGTSVSLAEAISDLDIDNRHKVIKEYTKWQDSDNIPPFLL
jgi:hypothetical protein